ncbi:MAG: FadR family transcriptional regulator [Lachnospiraceae bacterium]|nr:FadR family transcriptional regulator [Lachnospiraceae bacterium]
MVEQELFKTVQDSNKPLAQQVADQISQLIKEQNLEPGDKLPNEFELARDINVGRGTIREAVKLLVARNVVEIRRGKGTFVMENAGKMDDPFGFDFISDKEALARDLFEIRMQMEPWIASVAAQRASDEEIERLRECCARVEEDIRNKKDHTESDKALHTCISECTHNRVTPELLPIILHSVDFMTKLLDPQLLEDTIRLHTKIVDCIAAHDAEGAEKAMREHLYENVKWMGEFSRM